MDTYFTERRTFVPTCLLLLCGLSLAVNAPSFGQGTTASAANQHTKPQGADLTNAQVVRMLKAGLPENIILEKIRASSAKLDSSPDALIALKTAGASETVLNEIVNHDRANASSKIPSKGSNAKALESEPVAQLCKRGSSGDSSALRELVQRLDASRPGRVDFGCAREGFRQAAQKGDAFGQVGLGHIYQDGLGVPRDYSEALRLYRLAATQGNAYGEAALAVMYWNGFGVPRDDVEGLSWLRKAAEQGNAAGQRMLGSYYVMGLHVAKDYQQALYWTQKAADQNDAAGMSNLGAFYDNGIGVSRDPAEAIRWFRKAAELGYAGAEYNLGIFYNSGRGVEQNYAESARWFRKAAMQGVPDAANKLGFQYAQGQGVAVDYVEAAKWFQKGAGLGNQDAKTNLKVVQNKIPKLLAAGAAQQASPPVGGMVAHPMYVGFSFSSPGLADFGGDGAWGAAVSKDEQAAIDQSGNNCAANSKRPDWCGNGTGGRWPVCQADGKTRWVALAINNDGTAENWADGEAIGYETQADAEQAAVANCNHAGCHVVWRQQVDCGGEIHNACGVPSESLAWVNSVITAPNETISVERINGGVIVHKVSTAPYGNGGTDDTTMPFSEIKDVSLVHSGTMWFVLTTSINGFQEREFREYRKVTDVNQTHNGPQLRFSSEEAAKEAKDFFEFHRCSGK